MYLFVEITVSSGSTSLSGGWWATFSVRVELCSTSDVYFFKFSLLSPCILISSQSFRPKRYCFGRFLYKKCQNGTISVDEKDTFCDETLPFRQIFIQVSAENQCFSRYLYFKLAYLTKHSPKGFLDKLSKCCGLQIVTFGSIGVKQSTLLVRLFNFIQFSLFLFPFCFCFPFFFLIRYS